MVTRESLARPVREMAELPGRKDRQSREPWPGLGEEHGVTEGRSIERGMGNRWSWIGKRSM